MTFDTPLTDHCRIQPTFWRALDVLGLDTGQLLKSAGLPTNLPLSPKQFVRTEQFFALWHVMEKMTADPDLWLRFVQATIQAGHQPLIIAASYAATYREAFATIVRLKRCFMPEVFVIEDNRNEVSISKIWPHARTPEPYSSVDVGLALIIGIGRKGTGKAINPLRIELARTAPVSNAYRDYFQCPIRYGAPKNRIVLRAADFALPFPGHNQELLEILTPALAAAFDEDQLGRVSFTGQLKIVLKRHLASGRPDVSKVAQDLGMSERTLQRRITAEGANYRTVVMEARKELARRLLQEPQSEIGEVACLVGYQDVTSFYRAFREWEGMTPNHWRELHTSKASASE